MLPVILKITVSFLKNLSINNNRDWFNLNKDKYLAAQKNMIEFVDALIILMNKHDQIENESGKKSLYRIYNDVRFSKDKSPYSPRFACSLQRATRLKRGGYYLNIKPGNSYLACGFFGPNPDDLKTIRTDISYNQSEWNKILNSKKLISIFGKMQGEKVKTAPKGFPKEHPAIDLLRHKQFIFKHTFKDKEVLSHDFLKQVDTGFRSIRPFFDYMSEVLSTNANGEPITKF